MSDDTTEPIPIIAPESIVTPFNTVTLFASQTLSRIITFFEWFIRFPVCWQNIG